MYTVQDIAKKSGGRLIQKGSEEDKVFFNLITDTRNINFPGTAIFIPLITSVRNAHQFIPQAYAAGIRCFFTQEKIELAIYPDAHIIEVDDTLAALQKLVQAHRTECNAQVIAITGSNGKTIVKEFLSQLLLSDELIKSPKSYNSQLGVALSVWQMNEQHRIGIFEAGISLPNEMEKLEKMIQPKLGVFTMLGKAHDSGFKNTEHKLAEKLKLFKHCETIIYNKDERAVASAIETAYNDRNLISWGTHQDASLHILSIESKYRHSILQLKYQERRFECSIPFIDKAYIDNALIAMISYLTLKKSIDELLSSVQHLQPVSMRLELKQGINNTTLINDAYSADTASLKIALDFLMLQKQHNKRVLILSDILQHGDELKLYNKVANIISSYPIDEVYFIGQALEKNKALFLALPAKQHYFSSTNSFLAAFGQLNIHDETILIKGARRFAFEKIVNRLEHKIHQTVLSINLSALIHNIKIYKHKLKSKTKIMAMVKAFSYGSGSFEIANILQHYGIDYLAVAYVDEGIELRRNGIQLPILVLNPTADSVAAMLHYNLEAEIYSIELLQAFSAKLAELNKVLTVHIKFDTGMHRLGITKDDFPAFQTLLLAQKNMKVASVFSHLVGSGDETFDNFTTEQAILFEQMSATLEKTLGYTLIKHLCNSGGAVRHPAFQFDMVRLGLGLYGIDDTEEMKHQLIQIASLRASVSQIKQIPNNETVGYSRSGKVKRDTLSATVNIGYADGYKRAFSMGKGKVLIKGMLAPVIGNVCMDMIMVDITDIPNVKTGDEVIIFNEELSVTTLAQWINTIPYEIITSISQRIKRVYYQD